MFCTNCTIYLTPTTTTKHARVFCVSQEFQIVHFSSNNKSNNNVENTNKEKELFSQDLNEMWNYLKQIFVFLRAPAYYLI